MPTISGIIETLFRGRRFYVAVALCCLVEWFALRLVAPDCYFDSDSVSYFYPVNLFAGRISASRPPVYCLFLNALRGFGDARLATLVVLSQFACLLGTVLLAAKMLRALFRHEIPVLVVCGHLALQGYFWAKAINPECFSFCTVVLVVSLFWRMVLAPSKTLAWSIHLLMAFAVLLKPMFLVLAIALAMAWAFLAFSSPGGKRHLGAVVLSYLLSLGIVLGYCTMMQARHGMFTVSSIPLQNDLVDIVASSAWKTCKDSPAKAHLAGELQKHEDPYAGAFALQWAATPASEDSTDVFAICPEFLFESPNVRYCFGLREQYDNGTSFDRRELARFVREAKRQPAYCKFLLQRMLMAIGAPRGFLLLPFWLGFACLVLSLARRDHLMFFANLLLLGFIAAAILKHDGEQYARILFPVFLIQWMDLLHYFSLAFPKRPPASLPSP